MSDKCLNIFHVLATRCIWFAVDDEHARKSGICLRINGIRIFELGRFNSRTLAGEIEQAGGTQSEDAWDRTAEWWLWGG